MKRKNLVVASVIGIAVGAFALTFCISALILLGGGWVLTVRSPVDHPDREQVKIQNPGGVLPFKSMGDGSKITLVNGAATINDRLEITDLFDTQRRNCRSRRYQIDMVQGRTYTIDQMSGTIDSFLRLEDPTGAQVAINDDGGGIMGGGDMNLNARIIYVAPRTGTYIIIATSFDAQLGPFTLSVRETLPGDVPEKIK